MTPTRHPPATLPARPHQKARLTPCRSSLDRRTPRQRALSLLLAASLGWGSLMPLQAQTTAPSAVRLPALGEAASDDFNLSEEKLVG